MAQKQGGSKKKRATKKSLGEHGGGGKVKLSTVEKVLISSTYANRIGEQRERRIQREGGLRKTVAAK